ncbi:hypothetical protein [Roseomonas sp. CECT 9278]|uniref:hypothetical protein n=1 Tax=Roseomonas sp. CECT 9278 TaxID=2845823 RepID=UPI001E6383F0|nr:hypothetical protein [Roseomonas sp. CECT 9278]
MTEVEFQAAALRAYAAGGQVKLISLAIPGRPISSRAARLVLDGALWRPAWALLTDAEREAIMARRAAARGLTLDDYSEWLARWRGRLRAKGVIMSKNRRARIKAEQAASQHA